jgi:hypothetical protein
MQNVKVTKQGYIYEVKRTVFGKDNFEYVIARGNEEYDKVETMLRSKLGFDHVACAPHSKMTDFEVSFFKTYLLPHAVDYKPKQWIRRAPRLIENTSMAICVS